MRFFKTHQEVTYWEAFPTKIFLSERGKCSHALPGIIVWLQSKFLFRIQKASYTSEIVLSTCTLRMFRNSLNESMHKAPHWTWPMWNFSFATIRQQRTWRLAEPPELGTRSQRCPNWGQERILKKITRVVNFDTTFYTAFDVRTHRVETFPDRQLLWKTANVRANKKTITYE